jgi:predicted GNAT superfamily acetyltransferase
LAVDRSSVAWDAAVRAAEDARVSLKPIRGMTGAEEVGVVVEALWGPGQLPPSLIRAFDYAGTVILGADEKGNLIGIVLGFPGLDEGLHMHSHMLGVLPERQSRGVGYALKLGQRAACLDLGIDEVRWTYDPLVAKNGWFNIVKLGVVATRLHRGFYGRMDDEINRGDRSDRFEVRWRLESERVRRALRGGASEPAPGPVLLDVVGEPDTPRPQETGRSPEPGAVIRVPVAYHEMRRRDPALGEAWRDASARAFEACFQAGLVASWITRDGRYVFGSAEEESR